MQAELDTRLLIIRLFILFSGTGSSIYAGTNLGFYRSTDSGVNWGPSLTGKSDRSGIANKRCKFLRRYSEWII
ncbi:MAG: hypothetical protein IPG09_15920 [Ignavibacteria bacterium]|nr:hypothetical protein [Ignavibacteria bacterium]